ncbi:hypothetical protein GR702_07705 [Novosphingobium sp. FGD1]|jgi:tetratricopeptide (TPR) repeat protein|uniref:Tetratricopeptide repeat protein n=1 Tax=Novosphingobium silvae TaxID=2692619 RepID=A0A7X4K6Y3_9SPHN|nr:hypothetical protein [Novosphingobium silvae]MYL97659.1 hypothetical protein [Novosphingobium silvae]
MPLSSIAAAVLLGQAAFALPIDRPADGADVAYRELAAGQSHEVVRKLEGAGAGDIQDPAVLINLGAAYARAGMTDKALAAYRAAIASPERYDLELADGSWVDSRTAARMALRNMLGRSAIAAR